MDWPMVHHCKILVNAQEGIIQIISDPPQDMFSFGASIDRHNIIEETFIKLSVTKIWVFDNV